MSPRRRRAQGRRIWLRSGGLPHLQSVDSVPVGLVAAGAFRVSLCEPVKDT